MSRNEAEVAPVETARAAKCTPLSIRFHDPEWERIEAFAEDRGLAAAEFVRFAAPATIGEGTPGGGEFGRLTPLIERTYRYVDMVATNMRDEMLAAGREEELEELVGAARAVLQNELPRGVPD